MCKKLSVDIETYSSVDLIEEGLYKYVESPDFEVLLFGYKIDDRPACVVDLANGEQIPKAVMRYLYDPGVEKTAWNAAFEMACLSKFFDAPMLYRQWSCTMVKASYNGLPMSLDKTGQVLKLDKLKMSEGKDLIKYFCVPCKPTKKNRGRTRNFAKHDPGKWNLFKDYCARDCEVEHAIDKALPLELPKIEKKYWLMDQRINREGVRVDRELIENIIRLNDRNSEMLMERTIELTGVDNPNSPAQLRDWLSQEFDDDVKTVNAKAVQQLLKVAPNVNVTEVLNMRKELGLSSIKKYWTMLAMSDDDDIVRGLYEFYGAGRTGRWAGRKVQPQNLPRQKMRYKDIVYLRTLIKSGTDHYTLSMLYDRIAPLFKELIRTAFIPRSGNKFIIGDFSAIEAVVLSWLANEKWRLDVFKGHGKIYEASASKMFNVPMGKITKDSDLRQRGKVSELALGYGGAENALITMGALDMGLKESELPGIVSRWRWANPTVVKSWKTVEAAFKYALGNPGAVVGCLRGLLKFQFYKGCMLMKLPSGRYLVYRTPELISGQLSYYGMNQTTKQWCCQHIYGGKIIENAVQAIARDILANAMLEAHTKTRAQLVLHVHDELVGEVPEGDTETIRDITRIMSTAPPWAKDLPLKADIFQSPFYRKN